MKHKRSHRPAAGKPAAPGGLEAVFGVHAVRALIERGETPRELWVQEGSAGARLAELVEVAAPRRRPHPVASA